MEQKRTPKTALTSAERREQRLKAALKANMAKRKAQSRARASKDEGANQDVTNDKGQE